MRNAIAAPKCARTSSGLSRAARAASWRIAAKRPTSLASSASSGISADAFGSLSPALLVAAQALFLIARDADFGGLILGAMAAAGAFQGLGLRHLHLGALRHRVFLHS